MSTRITLTTAARVLRQLLNDRRTVVMIVAVPALLLTLMRYVMDDAFTVFNSVGLTMLGVFPLIVMFLITSVAMLRERTTGTLERILTTPTNKLDLIFGYGLAFSVAAAVQASVAVATAYWFLDIETLGGAGYVVLIAVLTAVLGMAIGLLVSAFATSEFQAVQFMPAIVLPQILICGLIWPRDEMAGWLEAASYAMPMTYAVKALEEVQTNVDATGAMWGYLGIVAAAAVLALALGAGTLRRRTD